MVNANREAEGSSSLSFFLFLFFLSCNDRDRRFFLLGFSAIFFLHVIVSNRVDHVPILNQLKHGSVRVLLDCIRTRIRSRC